MDRRHLLRATATLSIIGLATQARAQHDHHAAASAPVAASKPKYQPLQAAAADCVAKGQVCLAHCLQLLSTGDKAMGDCAQAVNQMLALCGALQNVAGQGGKLTPALAKVALSACEQCAEACKPHIEHHAECKACHDACLECGKQCKAVI